MKSEPLNSDETGHSRRALLGRTAAAIAYGTVIGGVFSTVDSAYAQRGAASVGPVELGTGDVGVLNFAYALEQLEAAFYTVVVAQPYAGMDGYERRVMRDLRDHEIAHREFFRRALGAERIPDLTVDFRSVNFSSRASVLKTAQTFEDLGVSAYNGAAQHLTDARYLMQAGRIVSVEARHAAIIRDIIDPLGASFAGDDVVNVLGLDVENSSSTVLRAADPYIATPISANRIG